MKKNLPAIKSIIEQEKVYLGEMLRIKIISRNDGEGEMRGGQDLMGGDEPTPDGKS
jgi:hypothetical protein